MASRISVPKAFVKYYKGSDYSLFVNEDVATEDEIELLREYAIQVLKLHDLKYCGLAVAKPQYFDVLNSNDLGALVISADMNNHKALWRLDGQEIIEITRSDIDKLFE